MSEPSLAGSILLRLATAGDTRCIHSWRNDSWIVSLGSSGKTVTWEEHEAWLRGVLADPNHMLFVIEIGGIGAGTVRLDRTRGDTAMVTIYLLREFTGKGFGVRALEDACTRGFSRWPIAAVHACIRADNRPSLGAFAKAGFASTGASDCPPDHVQMVLTRP